MKIATKKKCQGIIRFVLTLALVYGAYTETGKWTALSFLLVFIAIELICSTITLVSRRTRI